MTLGNRVLRMYPAVVLLAGFAVVATPQGTAQGRQEVMGCPQASPDSTIRVKLLENLDSSTGKAGDTYRATLVDPLLTQGNVIAERGSEAEVRLVHLLQPKGSSAPPVFALQLAELNIGHEACRIVTGFAQARPQVLVVKHGVTPEGTSSVEVVLDAITEDAPLGSPAATIVNGAGVSFEVVSGQRVVVPKGAVVSFQVADLLSLGSKRAN
jgi:hypothetical protein